jgi:restriction system protein
MPIPDYQTLMLPLLRFAADGNDHTTREAVEILATEFQLQGWSIKSPSGAKR